MYNVAYYVHITVLMCNILHIICFYFSLHNIYISYDVIQILHIFPPTFMSYKHIFPPTFMQDKITKHDLFILLNPRNHDLLLIEYVPNHVLLNLYFTRFQT